MSLPTIAEALGYSAQLNSESPEVDVRLLLCRVLDVDSSYLRMWPDKSLTESQVEAFQNLFEQRKSGVPVAHLLGTRGFWTLDLEVSAETLIPRPDTECLVEYIFEHFDLAPKRMLDLGTGTGAIALAIAAERPEWKVLATDYKQSIVDLAVRNALQHKIANIDFAVGSWFEAVHEGHDFDLIVSNPPYIDGADHHLDHGDVRFEPRSALVAAENGFSDLRHIAERAPDVLVNGGMLCFEHGYEQGEQLRSLLADLGYSGMQTHRDYGGNDRFTTARFVK